jgi:hypothetical protein
VSLGGLFAVYELWLIRNEVLVVLWGACRAGYELGKSVFNLRVALLLIEKKCAHCSPEHVWRVQWRKGGGGGARFCGQS